MPITRMNILKFIMFRFVMGLSFLINNSLFLSLSLSLSYTCRINGDAADVVIFRDSACQGVCVQACVCRQRAYGKRQKMD